MRKRRLGTQGLEVAEIGLGCYGMSASYGPASDAESSATIRQALDLGVDFFDTSDVYGLGHNERLLGAALVDSRSRALIATKFGAVRTREGEPYTVDGSPGYVARACDASLGRLGIETIDLYYQHRVDPDTPIEETVGAMARLVDAGKVRFLGLSECSPETLRRAHAVHPISAVQIEYSLFSRGPEAGLIPTCRELGVGVVPYSPLGRGALTGTVTSADALPPQDVRRGHPRFQRENLEHNVELVRSLATFASAKSCTPGQLAIAWLLHQGDDLVPIPGTKRHEHLEENVAAAAVRLSSEECQQLVELLPTGSIAGARYADAELSRVGI